jgi:hypothetical protein
MTDLDVMLGKLSSEFPKFKIVSKEDSWLMRFIGVFLRVITLGKMSSFMDKFITTIGFVVYVPSDWLVYSPIQRIIILRHERVHMRQRVKYGMVLFTLLYLLCPLPVGFAYFRAKFEMEAYAETLLAMCELYVTGTGIIQTSSFKKSAMAHFTSAEYFWMWPFKKTIERWYADSVRKAVEACPCGMRY